MKIAFVFGTMHRGGAERVIASLANSFCQWGDDVSIITLDNEPSAYPLNEQVQHIHLNVAGNSRNAIEALQRNVRLFSRLRKQIKKAQYDVVVTFELRHAVGLLCVFPFGRKYSLIASERANPKERHLSKLERILWDAMLPRVDGFVFQTKRVSQCYSEKLRKKGAVIHNGVFTEILPQKLPRFEERNHKDICAVGRLCQQKGYDILLPAFQLFLKDHEGHHLHIFGEGVQREKIESQIKALGLEKTVILHGSVPNVTFQTVRMGMYVLPSRFEGMPNALMEAMACGLPCIAADCDFGPGELIANGENGMLVPVEDVEALAEAMGKIADDRVLAEKLSQNATDIRRTHSGEVIARRYHDYIMRVTEQKIKG